jgi:hypothetical protein
MNNQSNHLTPTPVVDKNGVLTTRNKKTDVTPSAKASSIPPVTLAPAPSYKEGSIEHLRALIYGKDAGTFNKSYLSLMEDDDKKIIPLAIRLLTTGSDIARSQVRATLENALYRLADAYDRSDIDELWTDRCRDARSPYVKHDMLTAWTASNIIDELELNENPAILGNKVTYLDEALAFVVDRSGDDNYWRGLAIVALTDLKVDRYNPQDRSLKNARVFAPWAGEHQDPARLIKIAKERGTLEVSTLIGVMKEQDETAAPLRDGAI